MKNFLFASTLFSLSSSLLVAQQDIGSDYLLFKNGDSLHGEYLGLDEGPLLKWRRGEAEQQGPFSLRDLRKVSFNGGMAKKTVEEGGMAVLSNGDRIPGTLIALDENTLTLSTPFAGELRIPRKNLTQLSPNRFGNKVIYAGPFNQEHWGTPEFESASEEEEERDYWYFGGSSWISDEKYFAPLRLDIPLEDRISIRFNVRWVAPLGFNIGLFSDFQRPIIPEKETRVRRVSETTPEGEDVPEEKAPLEFGDIIEQGMGDEDAETFGSGYLISIMSTYCRLARLSFDEEGHARRKTFTNSSSRLQLNGQYSANIEIRACRSEGSIRAYVDGQLAAEWQDLGDPFQDENCFLSFRDTLKGKVRISDLVVAPWNGMTDSALSMQHEERDILLFENGTDRISGELQSITDGIISIRSPLGDLKTPIDEIAKIHFATDSISEDDTYSDSHILVNLQPSGRLTLQPKEDVAGSLVGEHPILGELSIDLSYSYLIEFDSLTTIFDNWENDFSP